MPKTNLKLWEIPNHFLISNRTAAGDASSLPQKTFEDWHTCPDCALLMGGGMVSVLGREMAPTKKKRMENIIETLVRFDEKIVRKTEN